MFRKILIANRGEIAVRIIKTAKRLGIKTVAVFSNVDQQAMHVALADEAFCIGQAPSAQSYLCIDKIIAVAKQSQAQAIHPGYGFLSENADFVIACEKAGICFIGPTKDAILAMGSKSQAKAIMQQAGVPVIPGYHGKTQDTTHLIKQALAIGFPVLLKAVAGGGGKGMRLVHNEQALEEAIVGAKREAKASFNDERLLIEKYLKHPRHIEIQVFADSHGNVVHLFERDCSIQRRHQKIIEEAPAFTIPETIRQAMAHTAIKACQAINYLGAGTIELLYSEEQFYFMEMNTRLQVEHGVSEMITGLDFVEWQLIVAAGHPLPLSQNQIKCHGHAVEARIYAENPHQEFLPATGRIGFLQWPATSSSVRIDSGIQVNDTISPYYDPMIAKLMCWGETREQAINSLHTALMQSYLQGPHHNIDFLKRICEHADFIAGNVSTHFIPEHQQILFSHTSQTDISLVLASLYRLLSVENKAKPQQPFSSGNNWRMNLPRTQHIDFLINDEKITVHIELQKEAYRVHLPEGVSYCVTATLGDQELKATINKQHYQVTCFLQDKRITLFGLTDTITLDYFEAQTYYALSTQAAGQLTAPMPGTVVAIMVKPAQKVNAGDSLMVIEAMKMEHTIHAPTTGTVTELFYAVGHQVDEGAQLLTFEASSNKEIP